MELLNLQGSESCSRRLNFFGFLVKDGLNWSCEYC